MFLLSPPQTHLPVGFVDCSIGTTAQSLCEDEVSQFWRGKAGGRSHTDNSIKISQAGLGCNVLTICNWFQAILAFHSEVRGQVQLQNNNVNLGPGRDSKDSLSCYTLTEMVVCQIIPLLHSSNWTHVNYFHLAYFQLHHCVCPLQYTVSYFLINDTHKHSHT